MRLFSMLTAASLAIAWSALASSESLQVQCGESAGWSYYFAGGLVKKEMAGFQQDAITGGKTTLIWDGTNEGDVLYLDSTGKMASSSAEGGTVFVTSAGNGVNWLIMHSEGTLENYALHLPSMKVAAWRNTVGNGAVAKNSVLVADCTMQ